MQILMPSGLYLLDNNQPLLSVYFDLKRGPAVLPQRRIVSLDGRFDILRVVILPSNNHQVFEASGHEKLAILYEPQIACAKERPLAVSGQISFKSLPGLFWPIIISSCYAGSRHPYLADAVSRTRI